MTQTTPETELVDRWPDEIWAFQIQEHEFSGSYVCSEFATAPRWEGDSERDRPVERFVHGNVFDSQQRYYETILEQARDQISALQVKLEAAREALTEIYEYPSGQPIALNLDEADWQQRRAEQMRFVARAALKGDG